jgi:predicted nucleic acid-binding protein
MARQMICLDTNYLILGLTRDSRESKALVRWYQSGEALVVPMAAWYEFLCGPVKPAQIAAIRGFLTEIISFSETQAQIAAEIFEATGRKRSLKIDAMIAATAIAAGATLATNNQKDFKVFPRLRLL